MKLKINKRVVFYEWSHSYILDGEKTIPGVTTVLKKHGLSPNYDGIDEATLSNAAKRGTAVHKMLESYDNGEATVMQDVYSDSGKLLISNTDLAKSLENYKKLNLPIVASEYLISDNECVASSIDKVASTDKDNEFILYDVKTSATIHNDSYSWQLSLYAYLFEKQNPKAKVVGLAVIHIRNGEVKIVPMERKSDEECKALLNAEKNGEIYQPLFSNADSGELDLYASGEELCLLASNVAKLAEFKDTIKALEGAIAEIQDRIYNKMVEQNIEVLENEGMVIKLKKPYSKKAIDTKLLKSKYPDIAEEMTKESIVKGNIIITVK